MGGRGHTYERLLLSLRREDPLLIQFLRREDSFNPDLLRWEDTPLIWATPWLAASVRDGEEGSLLPLPVLTLAGIRADFFGI